MQGEEGTLTIIGLVVFFNLQIRGKYFICEIEQILRREIVKE